MIHYNIINNIIIDIIIIIIIIIIMSNGPSTSTIGSCSSSGCPDVGAATRRCKDT